MKKLPLLILMIFLSGAVWAQDKSLYTVTNESPFSITKNGKSFNSPQAQKSPAVKTRFITLDGRFNLYSYAEVPSEGLNIYRNGTLVRSYLLKESGFTILEADSLGNWSGFRMIGKKAAIYVNGKQVKSVDLDPSLSEKIVGVEPNGDVITLATDKSKSETSLKKNGASIQKSKIPNLQTITVVIRNVGKITSNTSRYIIQHGVVITPSPGSKSPCPEGSAADYNCLFDQGCVNKVGVLDLDCARRVVTSGVCPCHMARGSSTAFSVPTSDN